MDFTKEELDMFARERAAKEIQKLSMGRWISCKWGYKVQEDTLTIKIEWHLASGSSFEEEALDVFKQVLEAI